MTTLRFTHLYPSVVGFDRLLDTFDTMLTEKPTTFPPHNIVKVDDNNYLVELAVAGFNESEITIEVLKNTLTIKGEKNLDDTRNYLHRGIGTRSFKKTVTLADTVQVDGASLDNGVLTVKLVNIVPVEKQPVKIAINTVSKPQLLQEKV
jgi:molecular chaperone IbpA